MKKIWFNCDYAEGAHEKVLQKLIETNMVQTPGYSEDEYCAQAANLIRKACQAEEADVHFLVGGTQTNLTVISSALRSHQGVIAAASGHINVHETGAIESCGHKVLALPEKEGKISAEQIEQAVKLYWEDDSWEHIVQPKMVYLSSPTEYGTVYTKEELERISRVCRKNHLYLFLDGARLGYGLAAPGAELTLADYARLCDVFYIGGTKVGLLFGEAVVIPNDELKEDFRCIMKQKGGMLAKGRLLGVQFAAAFTDGLYLEMGRHANRLAMEIKEAFRKRGTPFYVDSPTNQQFVILSKRRWSSWRKTMCFPGWTG